MNDEDEKPVSEQIADLKARGTAPYTEFGVAFRALYDALILHAQLVERLLQLQEES